MLTVTSRTPCSTSRRASRQLWPKVLRPYRLAHWLVLGGNVERPLGSLGEDQAERLLVDVARPVVLGGVEGAVGIVHRFEQVLAVIQPGGVQAGGGVDLGDR